MKYEFDNSQGPRCQGGSPQCANRAIPNTTFCPIHGGNKQLQKQEMARVYEYRKSKWADKIAKHGNADNILYLGDEIAILHEIIDDTLAQADTLESCSDSIQALLSTLDSLKSNCALVEKEIANTVSKSSVAGYIKQIVDQIGDDGDGPTVKEQINALCARETGDLRWIKGHYNYPLRRVENYKDLRQEIGILRVMVEELLQSNRPLILKVTPLESYCSKINKLVASCVRIDRHTGNMVTKQELTVLADKVAAILSDYNIKIEVPIED